MKTRAVWACVGLCLVASVAAKADYYFYGVSFADFLNDNDRLWGALAPYPEWDASRCNLRDDWPLWDDDRTGDPDSCLLYTSPSPRDRTRSRMPSSA